MRNAYTKFLKKEKSICLRLQYIFLRRLLMANRQFPTLGNYHKISLCEAAKFCCEINYFICE